MLDLKVGEKFNGFMLDENGDIKDDSPLEELILEGVMFCDTFGHLVTMVKGVNYSVYSKVNKPEDNNDVETRINDRISVNSKDGVIKTNNISDGYHTFGELYKHRIHLYIGLCKSLCKSLCTKHLYLDNDGIRLYSVIRSKIHEDGLNVWNDWGMFLLCIHTPEGQISYHLDKEFWDQCDFAETEEKASIPFDGHSSDDVLDRLLKL